MCVYIYCVSAPERHPLVSRRLMRRVGTLCRRHRLTVFRCFFFLPVSMTRYNIIIFSAAVYNNIYYYFYQAYIYVTILNLSWNSTRIPMYRGVCSVLCVYNMPHTYIPVRPPRPMCVNMFIDYTVCRTQ